MKKLGLLFICILCVGLSVSPLFSPILNAFAVKADYLRVITEDTPFYKNAGDTDYLFYLPYTYYVKVLERSDDFIHVECYGESETAAIDGFVPSDKLFDDGLSVSSPYAQIKIKTATTSALYADSSTSLTMQYIFPEREMCYYGTYKNENGNLFFVGYNGRLGYVKEDDVYPFEVQNHPNELTFIEQEPPVEIEPTPQETPPATETPNDYFSLKIIIVVCLLFAGIVALFVALKQKPSRQVSTGYYDENEYE